MNSWAIALGHNPQIAVTSHGWALLAPLQLEGDTLSWTALLPDSGPRSIKVELLDNPNALHICAGDQILTETDRTFVHRSVRRMFRADEKFEDFWRRCRGLNLLCRCATLKAGALVRSASVFEDVVKTFCTTNCHWRNTKKMVVNLCRMFGESGSGGNRSLHAFPTVERVASLSEEDLKKAAVGYRGQYILRFARNVANGYIDLEQWDASADPIVLRDELLAVPGIGPYAANHILMLVGHYGFIPCDSDVSGYLGLSPRLHRRQAERVIKRRFAKWRNHAFLAYKFERVFSNRNYIDC